MTSGSDRWQARPALGGALRVAALVVPVLVGLGAAVLLATSLPAADGLLERIAWWSTVLGGSVLATYATDRVARRLLPLAVLLELSLVFPDRAPSRLRAIRSASVRDLDTTLARLRGEGVPMQPYEAAETLVTLVGILGLHDKRTRGHSERVRALTDLLTDELRLDEDARMRLRWAALVHDLGKLTVPVTVLNGTARLEPSEWELLRQHPDEGVRLVSGLLPWLGAWGAAVGEHHERWDGGGYPRGLAAEEISYAARLVSVCDAFETMTSARSYKAARTAADGRRELARCSGSQFDPAVVRAFLSISLGRLTWVLGPITWLAQVPFVAAADRAGQAVKAGAVAAAVGGLVALGAVPGPLAGTAEPPVLPVAVAAPPPAAVPQAPSQGAPAVTPDAVLPPALEPAAAPVEAAPLAVAPVVAAPVAVAPEPVVADPEPEPVVAPASPAPSPSVQPSPAPSVEPSPTAQPSPDPLPVATTVTAYLGPGGLGDGVPATSTATIARGGTTAYDRVVDTALTLTGEPRAVLLLDPQDRTGSPRLAVRLLDCAGETCTVLAEGEVRPDKAGAGTSTPYDVVLTRTSTAPQVVAAGRVLRLALSLSDTGTKADTLLALGGQGEGSSRLVLPATVLVAQVQDPAPVGPAVLLVVFLLLTLSALLPERRSPLVRPARGWRGSRRRPEIATGDRR